MGQRSSEKTTAASPLRHVLVPYDAGSRYSGVSRGMYSWKTLIPEVHAHLPRESGVLLPSLLTSQIKAVVRDGCIPISFGGDHSLTYHAYAGVFDAYGPIDVIVFDAHHDSYRSNMLSHYSVFYHLKETFKPNIYWSGVRKDIEDIDRASIAGDFSFLPRESKIYLSLDLDYFSPQYVPSVMDPIADAGEYSLETFRNTLETIQARVVAADIVEWIGAAPASPESNYVSDVYAVLEARLRA